MKKLAALVFSILTIAAIGAFGYAHHLARPRPLPARVLEAEAALAMEGLVAIAHFNVEHAVDLEPLILGSPDDAALPDPDSDAGASTRGLISALEAGGVDIRADFHHWLGALLSGESAAGIVQVWIGDIPTEPVQTALAERFVVKVAPEDDRLLLLSSENPDTCELSPPMALRVGPQELVLGEPALVARVVERLETGAAAEVDLADWRGFRESRLTSAALLAPDDVGEAIPNPMLQMAAGPALETIDPLSHVLIGAQLQVMPPGLAVTLRANARDAAWPTTQAQRFESWRSDILATRRDELPSLGELLERLSLEAEGSRLDGQVLLNRDFADNFMQAVVVEPMQLFFDAMGPGQSQPAGSASEGAPAEVLRDPSQLARIEERVDLTKLPAFEKPEFRSPEGVIRSGLFGIWVKALRVLPEDEDVFEIELAAESTRLPNLHLGDAFGSNSRIQLQVSHVRGGDGTNLLRAERCGAKRNDDGGRFMAGSSSDYRDDQWIQVNPSHTGSKTIRLRPGAGLHEVESVEGSVLVRMPTFVEKVRIDAPFEGKLIERPGIRIIFDASAPGEVQYTVSGERDRVLRASGLNAGSQALQEAGTSSMGRIGRPGTAVTRHYQGEVAALELELVSEEEQKRFPFRIENITPLSGMWASEDASLVEGQSRDAFRSKVRSAAPELAEACASGEQSAHLAPFRLCLKSAQSYWGEQVTSQFELYSPDHPVVRGNLSGLELAIDGFTVEAEGGGKDGGKGAAFVAASDRQFANLSPDFQHPYLKGDLHLQTQAEGEMSNKTIRSVRGQVIHRLPTRVHPLTLDVSELGNEILYSNGFYLRLVEVGENGMHIRVRGDRSRIVQLVLRDAKGERLAAGRARLEPAGDVPGEWVGIVHAAGEPTLLEVRYALGVDQLAFPFDLALGD